MSVDSETVKRVARLSRIAIDETRVESMRDELNAILNFAEQLNEVDVEGVEPMTSVVEQKIYLRKDEVSDGGYADKVTANAPVCDDNFFAVPKVVE